MSSFDFTVLRELRRNAGLSIAEVSAKSGVSPAVISKLERNQSRAELDTLLRLGKVFGFAAAELIHLAEAGVTRKLEVSGHRSEDFVFDEFRFRNLRCLYGRAPAGGLVSRPKIHRDDYELCRVIRGKVKVTLPNEAFTLGGGEAIEFDALLEHRYEALEESEILIIHLRKDKRI